MRKIDEGPGMAITWMLGKMVKFRNLFFTPRLDIKNDKIKVILCQKYFGMGSILNALPLIKSLRCNFPNAKIIFLTLKQHREIVDACQIADEVVTISFDSIAGFIKDVSYLVFHLSRKNIDISIDLEFFSKFTMIISFFTFSRIRIGLYQKRIRPDGVLTHEVYYNSYKHISEIYFAYAEALGIKRKPEYFNDLLPHFKLSLRDDMRKKYSLDRDKRIIIINPNSSDLYKNRCWPADSFIELIKMLLRDHPDSYYLLIGGKADYNNTSYIYKMSGNNSNLKNVCGQTTIKELFALIEMCDLFITNDSGPLHVASLYGNNIVAFFGPETPVVYGPLNKNALIFYAESLYCSPCLSVYDGKKSLYSEECRNNKCLGQFTPEVVYESIKNNFLENLAR